MNAQAVNLRSGIVSLGELAELTGYPCSQARAFAEKHAGPPTSRRRGGKIALYWRLEPLHAPLARLQLPGLRPGGWCSLSLAAKLLTQWPAEARRKMLDSQLVRQRMGASAAGTPCLLYSLADLLAVARHAPDFFQG